MQDRTVGDVARSSARRWDLPLIEDSAVPVGLIEFVHGDARRYDRRSPGVYVHAGADEVLLSTVTAQVFDSTVKK
jgi:hypothetical protein